jgi:hypothetical protein
MDEALKNLENLTLFLRQEVTRLSNDGTMPDVSYDLLYKASLQLIEVGDKIGQARGWIKIKS